MRWLVCITDSADMNLSKLQEIEDRAGVLHSMESQRIEYDVAIEQQHNSSSQKANQNEKAKNYIPGEGTRQNCKKNN